jgi:hypothetical protein
MSGALREGPKVGSNRTVEAEVLLRSVRSRLLSFVQPLVYSAGSLRHGASWIPAPGPSPLGIRRPDGAEAVFEAETVEAEEARRPGRA